MSLLSDTQGTPERVHALMRLLDVLGGSAERSEVEACMTAAATVESDFGQTLGAARSLGMVEGDRGLLRLSLGACPENYGAFSDLVHDRLLATRGDETSLMLDCYAFAARQTDEHAGLDWFQEATDKALADELLGFLDQKRPRSGTFNPSRVSPWLKWMEAVGLATKLPKGRRLLDVTTRLAREVEAARPRFGEHDVPGREFVAWVLDRMPYLPGGHRSVGLLGPPRDGTLSNLLSAALGCLADDGVLRLHPVGDASDAIMLAKDPIKGLRSFVSVRLLTPAGLP